MGSWEGMRDINETWAMGGQPVSRASSIRADGPWSAYSLWPPLKGRDREESHHGRQNVVEVKLAVLPAAGLDDGVVNLSVFVCDVVTPERRGEKVILASPSPFPLDLLPVTPGMLGGMELSRRESHSSSYWEELQWVDPSAIDTVTCHIRIRLHVDNSPAVPPLRPSPQPPPVRWPGHPLLFSLYLLAFGLSLFGTV